MVYNWIEGNGKMVYLTTAGKLWVNIGLIVLSILIGGLVFWLPYLKKRKSVSLRLFFAENRLLFYTALALVFGFISRTAFLDLLPGGLNQDEASAGYDAYAIFKYGIDRNGIRYPVHLVAWGSGQNALYSYLCMPFLLALGVNEISLRLPMALAGCISIFLLYRLLLRSFGARTALLGMLFLVVNPWHLMKSRWALESNLFPELLFFGFYLLIAELDGKRRGGGCFFRRLSSDCPLTVTAPPISFCSFSLSARSFICSSKEKLNGGKPSPMWPSSASYVCRLWRLSTSICSIKPPCIFYASPFPN
ncbi:MAG: hypothetical protein DBY05_07135 [Clostridiales bacterium]|nr:MAG: hypothetical protein DBY05_07135 [Clostridiales bacterium]